MKPRCEVLIDSMALIRVTKNKRLEQVTNGAHVGEQ